MIAANAPNIFFISFICLKFGKKKPAKNNWLSAGIKFIEVFYLGPLPPPPDEEPPPPLDEEPPELGELYDGLLLLGVE